MSDPDYTEREEPEPLRSQRDADELFEVIEGAFNAIQRRDGQPYRDPAYRAARSRFVAVVGEWLRRLRR